MQITRSTRWTRVNQWVGLAPTAILANLTCVIKTYVGNLPGTIGD